jgi:hypothetical protein
MGPAVYNTAVRVDTGGAAVRTVLWTGDWSWPVLGMRVLFAAGDEHGVKTRMGGCRLGGRCGAPGPWVARAVPGAHLLAGIDVNAMFYFAHSYAARQPRGLGPVRVSLRRPVGPRTAIGSGSRRQGGRRPAAVRVASQELPSCGC